MKNAVTQRVIEVLEIKNITPNALADKLGMYQQTISKQLREDGSGVSLTTVVGMLELFPDLSAEWLLRGEGDMKKGEEWKVTQFIPVQNNELVDALKDHIASLKAENEHLRKDIEEYKREKSGQAVAASGYGFVAAEDNPLTKTEMKSDIKQ
jgi:hypothetical protein